MRGILFGCLNHPDLERLKQFIAKEFGYDVVRYRVELYAVPIKSSQGKRRRIRP